MLKIIQGEGSEWGTGRNNGHVPSSEMKPLPFSIRVCHIFPLMWVPVTTAWRVLRLRLEERPSIWRVHVAVNKLNKQPRTAD
jgi:hypothetical protein